MSMCSMRELVILAALVSALHAASLLTGTDVQYKCQEDQDKIATLEAESFINDRHRHGYKFKFVSQDSRSAEKKSDPCEVILGITLEETECHIVNPKTLDQCKTRMETQTKVTAKCNVTVSSVQGKASVKRYTCDTEPASHEILVTKCPDCPSLLPLHDPKGLESVKTALQKFNKGSNHKSYFKLMEVGRISTQWMFSGQSFFSQFAIMETNCTNKEVPQNEESCKALCGEKARYGFCKATMVGIEEPVVECEIYEAKNTTHPWKHPAQSRRDCKFHGFPPGHRPGYGPPHRPGDEGHDPKDKTTDQRGHPEHAGRDPKDKIPDQRWRPEHSGRDPKDKIPDQRGRPEHSGRDPKDKTPDQRGHPEHAGRDPKDKTPDQRGRPEHAGRDPKDKTPDQRGHPEHAGHDPKDKNHDDKGHPEHPQLCLRRPSGVPESAHEFPCHGFVKIPPSIYPICPFPPPRLCRGPPDLIHPPSPRPPLPQ
ncbi:alpha-2-HS-glycoprotein 1 [Carassius carassius]|uniref:alpha-2-HS-glycoprotein 1 n=1 Tax=Carassius carassius TaxID=217509 RepID=UPI0028690E1C|nr:alpha-2-HS-glycoprotein 1 [Carassius carassius]